VAFAIGGIWIYYWKKRSRDQSENIGSRPRGVINEEDKIENEFEPENFEDTKPQNSAEKKEDDFGKDKQPHKNIHWTMKNFTKVHYIPEDKKEKNGSVPEFTEEMVEAAKKQFQLHDLDSNGFIDPNEFYLLMEEMNPNVAKSLLKKICEIQFKGAKKEGMDMDQFLKVYAELIAEPEWHKVKNSKNAKKKELTIKILHYHLESDRTSHGIMKYHDFNLLFIYFHKNIRRCTCCGI